MLSTPFLNMKKKNRVLIGRTQNETYIFHSQYIFYYKPTANDHIVSGQLIIKELDLGKRRDNSSITVEREKKSFGNCYLYNGLLEQ
jgi:hypothetical protein